MRYSSDWQGTVVWWGVVRSPSLSLLSYRLTCWLLCVDSCCHPACFTSHYATVNHHPHHQIQDYMKGDQGCSLQWPSILIDGPFVLCILYTLWYVDMPLFPLSGHSKPLGINVPPYASHSDPLGVILCCLEDGPVPLWCWVSSEDPLAQLVRKRNTLVLSTLRSTAL